ncbi:Di-copper centre-containing protein [Setomelanomma holmii]|uniref:Di-copper centre-containing protein n=1 Tax=Setomelanomma holmii TaxID=210430 RepID=A0A9P4LLI2_9PLEO|nr:Di-copper centre-containing protein [Setomelanomma holmii]
MHSLLISSVLTTYESAAALPQEHAAPFVDSPQYPSRFDTRQLGALSGFPSIYSPLPLSDFNTPKFARPLSFAEAALGVNASVTTIRDNFQLLKVLMPDLALPANPFPITIRSIEEELEPFEKRQSTCSNPRVRIEWDAYSTSDRQAFMDGIKCLFHRRPSGQFKNAQNRYEDLVALHASLTPTVHGNAIFLLWHRYLLWTFEDILRTECGFNRNFPWFDEAKYAGRFSQSSIFSSQWFGSLLVGGNCVTDGQFPNLALNIGPGSRNVRHCLSRNGDESKTANTRQSITDACNSRTSHADMASCQEGAAHAWGHNSIGAVMQDTYASPADPIFWLHHAYVDRNFRAWQNNNPSVRIRTVRGTDAYSNQLTPDSSIAVGGFRPTVRIRDVLDTQGSTLCYRYSY